MDLSGDWVGFYAYEDVSNSESINQDSDEFRFVRIEVTFRQNGNELMGQMRDVKNDSQTVSMRSYVFKHRKAFGLKNFLSWQKLLFFNPDVQLNLKSPTEASCNGHVKASEVFFVKTYAGQSEWSFSNQGAKKGGTSEPMQRVIYRGTLSEDGQSLCGTWEISEFHTVDGLLNEKLVGMFELRRTER